ncbi:unnamed protein product [Rotaria sp. Silwood1]|nr:unnamed protein product [Rotaria sp. Silwood1]CAF4533794.1 unnamed protein product [Rotaria sp. Silwood1]CAF4613189.1 unnamed protein product [Rotaria sp. Silwood1]
MADRTRVPNMLDTFMYYNTNPTPPFPGYGVPPTYLPNQTNVQPYVAQVGLDPWPVNVPAYPQEYETHFPLGTNYWCTPEYKLTPNNLNDSEPTLLIRENRAKPGVKLAFTEKGAESDPRVFRSRYGTSSDVPTRPYYAQPWLIDEIRKVKN